MAKVSFKVSARAARLIGRENIASSKGAIIELVKNGYDADSDVSIIYFDNQYDLHESLSDGEYENLLAKGILQSDLEKAYLETEEGGYTLINNGQEEGFLQELRGQLTKLNSLFIIDSGEGMTQSIIRNHWMTIGTDNKLADVFTKSGRVKAGAKGIGRFALDKLGSHCEMITIYNPASHEKDLGEDGNPTGFDGYKWVVNWEDFEGVFKTIDNVSADLTGLKDVAIQEKINEALPNVSLAKIKSKWKWKYGTILKITGLRDNWVDYYVNEVFSDLEVLIPPKGASDFQVFLFSSLKPEKYGEVLGSVCDDFDFKITARSDSNGKVQLRIHRQEYDVEAFDPRLFELEEMSKYPFRKNDFRRGYWTQKTSLRKLLPGFAEVDKSGILDQIGTFSFSLFFMKRTFNSVDASRFYHREFVSNNRKDWLDEFSGIKLFRDNFRVRPYGEGKTAAFDWLGLGLRKSKSPAGIAKSDGGWKVDPENISGQVQITRLANVNFEDKSSREGLQENEVFAVFKNIIISIIDVLEKDRAHIARAMDKSYKILNKGELDEEKAEKIAQSVLENENKSDNGSSTDSDPAGNEQNEKLLALAKLNQQKDETIDKLKDEQKLLRVMASSGLVMASFSHDLSKLNDVFLSRVDKLKKVLIERISEDDYSEVEGRKNPFVLMERMKTQDVKMRNWLNFSLGATRKDKRNRSQLVFTSYFSNLLDDWETVFEVREIRLDTSKIEDLKMRVFEIDFDSIFQNLIVNSISAFNKSKIDRPREITITAKSTSKNIIIEYFDSGPGLSDDIEDPNEIFNALYTTKRSPQTGEKIGTGLGMWLVKSVVEDNDGKVKLLFPEIGFGLRITFPVKFKRKNKS